MPQWCGPIRVIRARVPPVHREGHLLAVPVEGRARTRRHDRRGHRPGWLSALHILAAGASVREVTGVGTTFVGQTLAPVRDPWDAALRISSSDEEMAV